MVTAWVTNNQLDAVITPGIPDIKKWGIRDPQKIGFASLDLWEKRDAAITGIDQTAKEIAFAAIDLLISLVSHKRKGLPGNPMHWLIPGHWITGKTAIRVRNIPRPVGIENEPLT